MTDCNPVTSSFELQDRQRDLARRGRQQQRLLTFCLAGLAVVVLLNLLPGLGGVLAAISFSLAATFLVLLTLLISTGVFDRFSPPERIPTPGDDIAEHR